MHSGFTLLETLIGLAIFTILSMVGVLMSTGMYQGSIVRSDRDVIVALLVEARSYSMSGNNGRTWGVCSNSAQRTYVLFQVPYTGSQNVEQYPMDAHIVASSSPPLFVCQRGGVVFSHLSATTSSTTILIGQQNTTSTISINYEGTISY